MGLVKKTRYEYYLLRELRYPNVAKVILLKRLEQLRRFVHNIISLSCHEQVSLNLLVHGMINLLYYVQIFLTVQVFSIKLLWLHLDIAILLKGSIHNVSF